MNPFLKTILIFTHLTLFISVNSYSITDTLDASIDNTLYENDFGSLSNGKGEYFFAGTTLTDLIRRGLISFRVNDQIPPGAIITDVKLILHMSRTITGSQRVKLFKASKYWGEGNSDAFGEEGAGTQSEPGDATWIHNFYDTEFWNNPGGDFSDTVSGDLSIGGTGFYTWNDPQMAADVQRWVNNEIPDYGWILLGEESNIATAKRFDTKDNFDPDFRPKLIVTYTFDDVALRMRVLIEGLVQSSLFSAGIPQSYPDTFKVYLRNSFSPYSIVDSTKTFNELENWFVFKNAPSGSYYIMVDQRNSINTWSKLPQSFSVGVPFTHYDFTSAITQAFGNNLVLKDSNYCIFSGDVNKDNFINSIDVLLVYNSAVAFQTGYVVTDLNGDRIVDLEDLLIAYNNSINFVQERRP